MEHEFYSAVPNRFGAMRLLQPSLYLDKYVSGWQCSVCGRAFDLSPRERHSSAMYGSDVPTRIRHEFEVHSCGGGKDLCAKARNRVKKLPRLRP